MQDKRKETPQRTHMKTQTKGTTMSMRIRVYLVEVVVVNDGRDEIIPVEVDPTQVWPREAVLPYAEQIMRDEGYLVKCSCFVN